MRALTAAGSQLLGMFVSDWTQTLAILLILAVGWFLVRLLPSTAGFIVVALLAAALVYTTLSETRRREKQSA